MARSREPLCLEPESLEDFQSGDPNQDVNTPPQQLWSEMAHGTPAGQSSWRGTQVRLTDCTRQDRECVEADSSALNRKNPES